MTPSSPYAAALERMPVTRDETTVLGAPTRFWSYGDPNAAVSIVAVHGFRGDHHGLEPVIAQLSGVHVIAPDLPGFGESPAFTGRRHDIAGYALWLREFLASVPTQQRRVVLGHSFGSIIVAAALAEESGRHAGNDPDLADAVVLVNPIASPALAGPRGVLTRLAVAYYRLGAVLPERPGLALLRNPAIVRAMSVAMAKTRDRRLRRWIHGQHDAYFSRFADRRTVLEAFEASVGSDVSEFAAHITQPTLLVAAERDDIAPLEAQERLQPLFPDARLRVIPSVGHLIHYEAPRLAATHIMEFLAVLEEGRA